MSKIDKLNKLADRNEADKTGLVVKSSLTSEDISERLARALQVSEEEKAKASPIEIKTSKVEDNVDVADLSKKESTDYYTTIRIRVSTKKKMESIVSEIGCSLIDLFNAMSYEGE